MSRLVGSGTGLTVKVTFDHKTKAGERTECELVEGRVLQSEGRVAVEAGVPGTPRGLRQLRQREQGGEGVGGSDEEAACPIRAVLVGDRKSSESFSAKEQYDVTYLLENHFGI